VTGPGGRSLAELAVVLGAAQEAEAQVFALVGRWVRSVPEPEAKILLAIHSRHHGEHALEWANLRPSSAGRAGPPVAGLDAARLEVAAGLVTTVGRLTALVDHVMPALAMRAAPPPGPAVAEATVTRAVRSIGRDHRAQVAELAALLARLADDPPDPDAVRADLVALKPLAGAGTAGTGVEQSGRAPSPRR